ncbi:hypothetical protein ABH15_13190 [Methanoculleus taiwanensis]|uniref:Uncharacterized protein n=1 Tax=Methanoculleus taiwanensis TaxID=1550565 RepID=A0A498GZY2_9EURY|nr:hypothetical protein [Methanoculleus taiwanensis]RXE55166.1 hypothetical protein ABH15_13190 [Methanoculleus taiwanensis]
MPPAHRDDGLSEVVGFVLILGVIVLALSLYQLYGVPAIGRENEILHMNAVKDRFIDYKIALDSLWTNNQTGVTLSTSFDLSTEGGYTQGGGMIFPVLAPIPSSGAINVNRRGTENITIEYDGTTVAGFPKEMGAVQFASANNYWIEQTYYYQLGALFLAQDGGATVRLSPPISCYKTTNDDITVEIVALQMYGYQETAGKGVARLDTRLKNGLQTVTPTTGNAHNVTIKVSADDATAREVWDRQGTAELWEHAFSDAAARGYLPSTNYTISSDDDWASIAILNPTTRYVNLKVTTASYSAILQEITTA